LKNILIVAAGSGVGGVFRYWFVSIVHKFLPATFPFGTLFVNVMGSFLLGIIIFYFDTHEFLSPEIKIFLTIGVCGGFTTFSTFSLETVNLLIDSEYLYAGLNALLNFSVSIIGVWLAFIISKNIIGD
jgi:CrcB protein